MYINGDYSDIMFEKVNDTIEIQTHNIYGDTCDVTLDKDDIKELIAYLQEFILINS